MIDMGMHKGKHLWYTGNRSLAELIQAGEILAVPYPVDGIVFKRTENCSDLERMGAYSLEELRAIAAQQKED